MSDDCGMDVIDAVAAVDRLWGLENGGWSVIVEGETATVHLPRAGVVVHVSRSEVGSRRVAALQSARSRLARDGIPVIDLVPSIGGATWEQVDGRVIEVERWVDHDGRMNTWDRLRPGAALLAEVHNAWADLDLGSDGEACDWANWISPAEVGPGCKTTAERLSAWGLQELSDQVVHLAELTAEEVALPTQVVHGDFWDNNVYIRDERLIAVTDFDFLGRRPRVDDLALLLYFADEQPYFDGCAYRDADTRRAELAPLVRAYAGKLSVPLTTTELEALPYALARQPLWTYGKWLLTDPDDDHARGEALDTAPAVARALEIVTGADPWINTFSATT